MIPSRTLSLARALLILGRVSNLPTVWSNCLAGWWLGGAEDARKLPLLFSGATLLYIGGMFLNDACDVDFDREFRRQRPIPSGEISANAVWLLGGVWVISGCLLLFAAGPTTGCFGLALGSAILLYDAFHKRIAWAPVLMASCRFLLYLVAASVGEHGVTGWAWWCGVALAFYVGGLSCFARKESVAGGVPAWPVALLPAPMILAFFMNVDEARHSALLLCAVLGLWIVRSLRYTLWDPAPNVGRTIAGLLAGIVFVDWVAIADAPRALSAVILALFLLALGAQRFVPAT
jgi:4-hydroxybenzoate polyprenyltransferase